MQSVKDFPDERQMISWCVINARFQNGNTEKKLSELQEQAHKQFHHDKAIYSLWPYALRQLNHIKNYYMFRKMG